VLVEEEPPWLCHLELQASYERSLPWRLLRYNALLGARDQLPVETVLFLLRAYPKRGTERAGSPGEDLCDGQSL
jgi:hypothetical protein